jgi:hypothetical protein
LNTGRREDWKNRQDWQDQVTENPVLDMENPTPCYWKRRTFKQQLSSE